MRDEMDARMWNEHHDQLSASIDNGLAAIGGAIKLGVSEIPTLPRQLLAGLAAFGITLATLGATIA